MRLINVIIVLIVIDLLSIKDFVNSGPGMFFTLMKLQEFKELDVNNGSHFCKRFMKLQRPICERHAGLIPSVLQGVNIGIQECQYQFSKNHWNCFGHNITIPAHFSSKRKKSNNKKTYFDNLINKGLPESSFLLAIISGTVTHQVAKACSTGRNAYCGCDRTIYDTPGEQNFQWAGCSENVHFGAAFAKRFLDVPHKRKIKRNPKLALVSLHNSHAGTKSVIDNMAIKCKCHGVSGSCEMKTCYRAMPTLRDIGDILKKKFSKAIYVDVQDFKLTAHYSSDGNVNEDDLAFIRKPLDFCNHNPNHGSLGTKGRLCNNTQSLNDENIEGSCNILCCKRGLGITEYTKKEKCRCKFIWCCTVECDTCDVKVVESVCH